MNRVVIVGPESSGKTTLAEQLAKHYKRPLVPEYAREYIDGLSRPYNFDDLQSIAKEQTHLELVVKNQTKGQFIICDTDLIVIRVWAMDKFGKLPEVAQSYHPESRDLYLIMMPDLPWEADQQRENPKDRDRIFDLYIEELERFPYFYQIIDGQGDTRFRKAVAAIDHHFQIP